jgi:hypothetical protein
MPRYDLAGNLLPEPSSPLPPDPAFLLDSPPMPSGPNQFVYAPAPPTAPAAPPAPHVLLTRGLARETPAQRVRAYAGLVGTLLLLIALTYAAAALPTPRISAPVSYTPVMVQDASLTCAAPDGWERQDDPISVSFTKGKARIEILAPPADMTSSSQSLTDLHTQMQTLLAHALPDSQFQEQPPQPLPTGMGEALFSAWSAAPGLAHLQGCRATLMAGNSAAEVICLCPKRDWAALQPAFLHVIQSLAPIQNGGQSS